MTLHEIASRALPADALCGLDESECASVDRIARAVEASGYGSAAAHRTAILRALGEHLRTYDDAQNALRYLASLDHRLATWGACACAREALQFVPAGEERPLLAIETTERWLAGQATVDEVRSANYAASAAANDSYSSAYATSSSDYAAAHSATSAYAAAHSTARAAKSATDAGSAERAANSAATAAANSAERAGYYGVGWPAIRTAELSRLVAVIADALPGLPPEVIA